MSYLDELKRRKLQLVQDLNSYPTVYNLIQSLPNDANGTEVKRKYRRVKQVLRELMAPDVRNTYDERSKVYQNIRDIEKMIAEEEKKIKASTDDAYKKRREIMQDRHKQLMQLLDRMDQKRIADGASSLQIEQERTRRAQISREIQTLINDNDTQDRADLDGLLNELRTMATQGLP